MTLHHSFPSVFFSPSVHCPGSVLCDACASVCYAAVSYGLVECVSEVCVVLSLESKGLTINPVGKKVKVV